MSTLKVAQSCLILCNPIEYSMEFSRPEYWSGLPIPSSGHLPNPGIKSGYPAFQADFFTSWATREDLSSILGLGRSPVEGKGYPLQYSGLENSRDCVVHGISKSWAQLSDFHFHLSKQIFECKIGLL